MIKAIIFDFDGVICESVEVKVDAFRKLFAGYPRQLKTILHYHRTNGGLSRFKKFRYIYKNFLEIPLSDKKSSELGKKFAEYSLQGVIDSKFVKGALRFLEENHKRYKCFVVSGTPEREMRYIVRARKLGKYFKKIYGSPRTKAQLINLILKQNKLNKGEVIFVGDSINDYDGAKRAKIVFVGRVYSGKEAVFPKAAFVKGKIRDLRQLKSILTRYNKH